MTGNLIVWAHSDRRGGTELACLVAQHVRDEWPRQGRGNLSISIVSPQPSAVEDFFFGKLPPGVQARKSREYLSLGRKEGAVSAAETAKLLRTSFGHANAGWPKALASAVGVSSDCVKDLVGKETVLISCGDPIALAAGEAAGIPRERRIIVTDHFMTFTVRRVLEHGGLSDEFADLLSRLQDFDRLASAAYLSALEFASADYVQYLADGGVPRMFLNGLFYDVPEDLEANESHCELAGSLESTQTPLVIVFPGTPEPGGAWHAIMTRLFEQGERIAQGASQDVPFSLLLKGTKDSPGQFPPGSPLWTLYMPGRSRVMLEDPKRLEYWYALARLVVGRGGLAAQQVLALGLGRPDRAPEMLFVEEPGHPQIEAERLALYRSRLVHTTELGTFRGQPLDVIVEALGRPLKTRVSVPIQYAQHAMQRLARAIVAEHFP